MIKNVCFPAFLVSETGWAELVHDETRITQWSHYGIIMHQGTRMMLLDSKDAAWRLSISSKTPLNLFHRLLAYTVYNPVVSVSLRMNPEADSLAETLEVLNKAIDKDDDCLTQWTSAEALKKAIREADSFKALVSILKKRRAI